MIHESPMYRKGAQFTGDGIDSRQTRGKRAAARASVRVLISLGTDYQEACRRLRAVRRGELDQRANESKVTVGDAAQRWLDLRIATGRNAAGRELAKTRVQTYLTPYLGRRMVRG